MTTAASNTEPPHSMCTSCQCQTHNQPEEQVEEKQQEPEEEQVPTLVPTVISWWILL